MTTDRERNYFDDVFKAMIREEIRNRMQKYRTVCLDVHDSNNFDISKRGLAGYFEDTSDQIVSPTLPAENFEYTFILYPAEIPIIDLVNTNVQIHKRTARLIRRGRYVDAGVHQIEMGARNALYDLSFKNNLDTVVQSWEPRQLEIDRRLRRVVESWSERLIKLTDDTVQEALGPFTEQIREGARNAYNEKQLEIIGTTHNFDFATGLVNPEYEIGVNRLE